MKTKKVKILLIMLSFQLCNELARAQSISIPELLVNATTRIECYGDTTINGQRLQFTSVGTGFFFAFTFEKDTITCIVTNFHVIKNSKKGILRFTEGGNSPNYGHIVTKNIDSFSTLWIKHPTQDLAIMPISKIEKEMIQSGKSPFIVYFNESNLPNQSLLDDLTAIEDVLMIGYPVGFWDKINNLPVVRKGLTATPTYLNYDGKPEFLLDIPIYPGSSGSPIILYNQGSYSSRKGGLTVGSRLSLLGINVESVNTPITGEVNVSNAHVTTTTNIPINIAIVIKSSELLAFKPMLRNFIYKK
ncbi:MAG TPA: serine protease [Mucilaginibacter sp.]